jgi:hypothetical protein
MVTNKHGQRPIVNLVDEWIQDFYNDSRKFDSYLGSVFKILGEKIDSESHGGDSSQDKSKTNKGKNIYGSRTKKSARARRTIGRVPIMDGAQGFSSEAGSGHKQNSIKNRQKRPRANKAYKRTFGVSLPVSYDNNLSIMPSNGVASKVKFRKRPTRDDVTRQDQEAVEQFTTSPIELGQSMLYLIAGSCVCSAAVLGIIPKATTLGSVSLKRLSVSQSVELLSKDTNSGFPLFGRKKQ